MKNKVLLGLSLIVLLGLSACNNNSGSSSNSTVISGSTIDPETSDATSVSGISIRDDTITGAFSLLDPDGNAVTASSGKYTLNAAGTYTASGKLTDGQLYVDASGLNVEILLEGVSISNSSLSPIYVKTCSNFELKAKNGYDNFVYDYRTTDYSKTSTSDGQGAVFASDGDMKVTGQGYLYVFSKQNSGIHGKDNVRVKNLTLVVVAQNNGIKGNDKVVIEENPTINIYADNNGIVTTKSDVGSSAQHGYIYLNGGTILVNSNGDGIDAAYSVEVGTSTDSEGVTYTPNIAVYTGVYSEFYSSSTNSSSAIKLLPQMPGGMGPGGDTSGKSAAEKDANTAKGIKAANAVNITAGNIYVQTYDDGLHADITTLDSNIKSNGAISISGGVTKVYASDDGVHADGALSVSGGTLDIIASHEGVEGKAVTVSGGTVRVSPVYTKDSYGVSIATDDAINASNSITITGGYLDVSVNSNGDYDCVDSNGAYTQSGGVVIARGPNSGMAGAVDCDGAISVTNGTLIVCGTIEGKSTSYSTSNKGAVIANINSTGSHTVSINGTNYTFSNSYTYNAGAYYSNYTVTNA